MKDCFCIGICKRLRHAPKKYIIQLVERRYLPNRLTKFTRISLCPACAFMDATESRWRVKGGFKPIRKDKDESGYHTTCDHLISHESEIHPQISERLTYHRYDGATLSSDSVQDYNLKYYINVYGGDYIF